LGKIWSIASGGKSGLGKQGVVKMLACIGRAQSGSTLNTTEYASAPPPRIVGLPVPVGAVPKSAPVDVAAAVVSAPLASPATVLEQMAETMFTLFKVDHKSGTLSGAQLQPVFAKCEPKVGTAMLRKIWSAASDGAAALDHAKVVKMLGFIGQAQAGATPNPSAYLSAPPPTIVGLPIPKET
jgi:hypothetical protein